MEWSAYKDLIRPELLILIPVLYFIGAILKRSSRVKDSWIPMILGIAGVMLSLLYVIATCRIFTVQDILLTILVGLTQGILVAGEAVFFHQVYKQTIKKA